MSKVKENRIHIKKANVKELLADKANVKELLAGKANVKDLPAGKALKQVFSHTIKCIIKNITCSI